MFLKKFICFGFQKFFFDTFYILRKTKKSDSKVLIVCRNISEIILNRSWPEQSPAVFHSIYGVDVLHDPLPEVVLISEREQAVSYAQRGINFIKKNIFPIHGI